MVVAVGWRLRRHGRSWVPLVARYSRVALWLVVLLGTAGVISAAQLVPSWPDLWETGYGRLVVAKAGLLTLAIAAAAISRWRGLPGRKARRLRRFMTGEVSLLTAAVVLAGVLANGASPAPLGSADELLGPPPLEGEVVRDAGLSGQLNVAVASNGRRLDVDVFGPSGPLSGTEVGVTLERPDGTSVDLDPRPCGVGCYTQALDLAAGSTTIRVAASAPDWTGGYYVAELTWPAGQLVPERLTEVVETMRQVPELTVIETTTSGPGSTATPMRVMLDGERFVASEPYAGANVDDVRVGDDGTLTVWLPGEQIFVTLTLDDAGRITEERFVSRGHEILRRFEYPTPGA
jgi:copper transport protein